MFYNLKCSILNIIYVYVASKASEGGPGDVIKQHGDEQVTGVEGAEVGTVPHRAEISVDVPLYRVVVHTRIALIPHRCVCLGE